MKYLARPPEKGYSTRLSDWKDLIAEEKAIPETSVSLYFTAVTSTLWK